ncbi:MAG: hypothetical protein HW397_296 [Dehalococcoidia bacterium]|nr:hypothetical protein [Dehalococcoidia bacterium]
MANRARGGGELPDRQGIGKRYSWRQRANSYAEIGKLLGKLEGSSIPGVACVLAITDVFRADVLDARNDEEEIPNKLRATGNEADQLVASRTERGMRAIRREAMHLQPPSDDTFRDLYAKVKMLHGQAYLWDPPGEFAPPAPNERVRVRLNLKRWIHEWDLKRLYPGYLPHIEVIELKEDLSEHAEMEKPTETSEESGEDRAHE